MMRLWGLAVLLITAAGCAEVGTIGKAAFRELRSGGINVEQALYQRQEPAGERTAVAQAPQAAIRQTQAAKPRQKGLWERQ
ncbi:hypothetical protein SAMN06269301_3540 [Geobacter sp. DSM 9736]|nr:hypothetical protein SAMN06269301_3540 [Geobacter sp. DSM 9736]